jgi:hypothetical protein
LKTATPFLCRYLYTVVGLSAVGMKIAFTIFTVEPVIADLIGVFLVFRRSCDRYDLSRHNHITAFLFSVINH